MKLIGVEIEKVLGSRIKTIDVFVSNPFGDSGVPILELSKMILEDGREIYIEGEHDSAYICISEKGIIKEELFKLAEENGLLGDVKQELDVE